MYIDPAFAGLLLQVLIGIAAVAGIVWFSIKRKARKLLKKDDIPTRIARDEDESGEIVDTLEDE